MLVGLGLLAATALPARADPLLAQSISLAGPAMWLISGSPGMVLAVVRGPETIIAGYGETAKGNGHEPDSHSLVRLGSVTKVFAAEVLGALAADGTLRLTDPLERYASGIAVPSRDGQAITLLDLATHTAGLPREMGMTSDKPQFTWPTHADRWAWLPKQTLGWTPGTAAAYSNIGFDLLTDALAAAGGKPYAELLHRYVTGPVGMVDTGFSPSPEQCARLMQGTGLMPAAPCLDTSATQGNGGLYSTAADMALWLRHNLIDTSPALLLSQAAYRQRQSLQAAIGFDEGGPMNALALGWVVLQGHGVEPTILQKSGGGAGFMSYVAFAPGTGVGVFVALNRVDLGAFPGMAQAANALIASLVPR